MPQNKKRDRVGKNATNYNKQVSKRIIKIFTEDKMDKILWIIFNRNIKFQELY